MTTQLVPGRVRHLVVAAAPLVLCAASEVRADQAGFGWDLMRPPVVERRIEVKDALPSWAVLPRSARILGSKGVKMVSVRSSAVSLENARLGLLVGALRNTGGCLTDVVLRLQYTDAQWQPLGDKIESEARVGRAEPGSLVPFKFRLAAKSSFDTPPSSVIIEVSEAGQPIGGLLEWIDGSEEDDVLPCGPEPTVTTAAVETHRSTATGYRVEGRLKVVSGASIRSDAVVLTALLLDEDDQVLDVLTGVPDAGKADSDGTVSVGQERRFVMVSPLPLGSSVKTTQVFVQLLADVQPPQ